MTNSIKLFLITSVLILGAGIVLAQETSSAATDAVNLDENIQPADLGVSEPKLLPDSSFYFLKEWKRGIQTFFTFDSVAKAELKEKISNEKLIELQKLVEQNKRPEVVEKAVQNYQKGVEAVKNAVDKIKEKAEQNPEVGKFLDKFIQQQTLQERILQKLETKVATSTFEIIQEAREIHLERFNEVMIKLENKEKIQERLENNLQEIKGSEFKEFKNLEILKELELKAPQELKETLQNVQQNSLIKLKEKIESLPVESQQNFNDYIEKISGSKEKQLEILENVKSELKCDVSITCQEGYFPYDTGVKDDSGCPIKKCVEIEKSTNQP